MPGTEALGAEWHHLKSHQCPVQGLGLEKGQAYVSGSARNEEALPGLGAVSVTLKKRGRDGGPPTQPRKSRERTEAGIY